MFILCNDFNEDGCIIVYDVSLLFNCYLYGMLYLYIGGGVYDYCNFLVGVFNIIDIILFIIMDINFEEGYVDIGFYNFFVWINVY